jgi:hypothetical protein
VRAAAREQKIGEAVCSANSLARVSRASIVEQSERISVTSINPRKRRYIISSLLSTITVP